MERIKKALERARKERETVRGAAQLSIQPPKSADRQRLKGVSSVSTVAALQAREIDISPEILEKNRVLTTIHDDAVKHSYKLLRTQVLQRMHEQEWTSLAVTGPEIGVGKTLTAINLAISVAENVNHSVVLVDLDLRRPSIYKYFGFTPEYGLSDYLQGDVDLHEVLIDPGIERLVLVPGNKSLSNSSEMLSSPKMVELVNELKAHDPRRLLIFDLPPLLSSDDMLAFSPYVDATLLVLEEGKTTRAAIGRTLELMKGTNLLGSVLNHSHEITAGGYY